MAIIIIRREGVVEMSSTEVPYAQAMPDGFISRLYGYL